MSDIITVKSLHTGVRLLETFDLVPSIMRIAQNWTTAFYNEFERKK